MSSSPHISPNTRRPAISAATRGSPSWSLAARKPGQQTPYLAITGTARIVEGGAPALLKKLAKVMLGSDEHFPPPNAPEGLLTCVRIEKVGGLGPWTS